MSSLFDMIAGTSTGSLLVSALVMPNLNKTSTNAYYATDIIDIYETVGP